ncbi:cell wall-binding repeat-containing protein [Clostridioides mangenotii]|uniref:cell wall-binding repeat-containing protein n=1 Tax=Metaclostridioides mangenotii TaxID=1540 RepID=UPI001C0F4DC8|nr:cell wall-binding repeat-containing protein [Clostridioides mangenotii]
MNKKLKKILSVALTFGMIISSASSINAYGKNTGQIDVNNDQTPIERKSINNYFKKNSKEVQKTPVLNDWVTTKTARVGNDTVHYIDGLSFENYDDGDHTTGLSNVMLNVFGWERYDKAAKLEKVVVPHIDIEANYTETEEKTAGVRIVLAGWTTNFDFQLPKRFMKPGTNVETPTTKLSETDEETDEEKGEVVDGDMVFTREEILNAIKKEMIADGKEVPSNDDDIEMPNEYLIYYIPVNEKGEQIYWRGINKLEQKSPTEFHYTTVDKPVYEKGFYEYFDAYFDWYTTSTNDRTESRTSIKYPYYETSDIKITPDKTRDLNPGDVVNLEIEINNPTQYIKNKFLTGGYDVIKSTGEENRVDEFNLKDENDTWVTIEPGQTINYKKTYTIPQDYKGDKIELKPYLYGVYAEYDYSTASSKLYFEPDSLEYNDSVTLYMKKSSGGGGGGSVDPGPNPPSPSKTVIIASGEKYTDVLTATVLGNEKNAPILLSQKDRVDEKTLAEIKRLNAEDIIISGGTDSVSNKVEEQLKDYNVTRIAGQDRYETAEKIGNEVRKTGNKEGAMLVDGTNFPDVITMSSLASQKKVPILLTEPQTLTDAAKDTIKTWGINDITIGGGYNSVSKDIENNLGVSKITRFGGEDRYKTAGLIGDEVRKISGNNDDMILVDGMDFPDGITINSLASYFKAPIMLTDPEHLNSLTADKIKEWSIKNILIGGGYNSVSKEVEDNLGVSKKERVAGQDRYETAVKISQRLSQTGKALGSK